MNMNSLIRPLLGLSLVITGCGKAEIEYRHTSKAKAVESSKSTEEGNRRRHELKESNQTHFRLAIDGRPPDEPQVKQMVEVKTVPVTEATREPQQIVTIHAETFNIHVGDVHHHTHVHPTTIVHAPSPKSVIQEQKSEPLRANNERCERLRREYKAREAEWLRLFDRH